MTVLQFLDSKLDEDTPTGDLARDAKRDKGFAEKTSDTERLSYLEYATRNLGDVYEMFLAEFNSVKK